jgi:hypothetical protein
MEAHRPEPEESWQDRQFDEQHRQVLDLFAVSVSVCYNRDCFYYDKTNDSCVGNYNACTVKQTER